MSEGLNTELKYKFDILVCIALACLICCVCNHHEIPRSGVQLRLDVHEGSIDMLANDTLILRYHLKEIQPGNDLPGYYARSGHVHPLRTPDGQVLTDGFPEGHTHQHGLFMTWVNVRFKDEKIDFWNQQNGTGTVRHHSLVGEQRSVDTIGFTVKLEHVSLDQGAVIVEDRRYQLIRLDSLIVLDITSNQMNPGSDSIYLDQYHYGGMAFRGSAFWNLEDDSFADSMKVVTSQGFNRMDANHSRPYWTAAYGQLPSSIGGVVMFCHPSNFRFPQPVRVHPEMPYFVYTPVYLGPMYIEPGAVFQSRYRIFPFDGPPDIPMIESIWKNYGGSFED